jgi:magnesium-transporting ATPase (P-type)
MKKIINYLNSIAKDKYQHFAIGAVIAAVSIVFFAALLDFWLALLASMVTVAAVAKFKEHHDAKNGGFFDWQDFIATCTGGGVVWIAVIALAWLIL